MRVLGPRRISAAAACAVGLLIADSASAVPVYVGSWQVDNGPSWATLPSAYSGQQAAALLFGGNPSDYAISTIDDNPANIDFMAWVSTWGGGKLGLCAGAFPCGTKVAEDFDVSTAGVYRNPGDISAYVNDWAIGPQYTNYVFVDNAPGVTALNGVAEIPEPATLVLFGTGLAAAGLLRRRRRRA
jgi:hypothetical protein